MSEMICGKGVSLVFMCIVIMALIFGGRIPGDSRLSALHLLMLCSVLSVRRYIVDRGSCLELYYCNMVEWFWWDLSVIFDDQLVPLSALTLLIWSSDL